MADTKNGEEWRRKFKRPRLEKVAYGASSEVYLNSLDDDKTHNGVLDRLGPTYEVTSSSEQQNDVCSGDSGFHEMPHPGTVNESEKDQSEPDSSGTADEHQPSFSSCFPLANQSLDSEENEIETDEDEVGSTISDISGLSDISDLSGQEWKPIVGPVSWVQRQMSLGMNPRTILKELVPEDAVIPSHLDEVTLWKVIVNILSEPPVRSKLSDVNVFGDVIDLLHKSKKIIVLTGAGVSVSSGIPDFRSRNGIYARLSKDFPDLPDPQAMFDINYFRKDQRPFFKFAKEIYPGQFHPSISHKFIRLLEQKNKLLRNYSQNIDTLEQLCGIEKVITCHGSFATASCTRCRLKVGCSVIKEDIFNQRIPHCMLCPENSDDIAVMKPDIVFFGEGLSDEFHQTMAKDRSQCDLLIVMGSSLKVRPVALIPSSIPADVPQILINREPLKHLTFDVELLGDCDVIIEEICRRFQPEWPVLENSVKSLREITEIPRSPKTAKTRKQIVKENELNNNGRRTAVVLPSSEQGATEEESNSCDYKSFSNIKLDDAACQTSGSSPEVTSSSISPHVEDIEVSGRLNWQRESMASHLPDDAYLFIPPSRYIFPGAEVYIEQCSSDADDPFESESCSISTLADDELDAGIDITDSVERRNCVVEKSIKDSESQEESTDDCDSGYGPSNSLDNQN